MKRFAVAVFAVCAAAGFYVATPAFALDPPVMPVMPVLTPSMPATPSLPATPAQEPPVAEIPVMPVAEIPVMAADGRSVPGKATRMNVPVEAPLVTMPRLVATVAVQAPESPGMPNRQVVEIVYLPTPQELLAGLKASEPDPVMQMDVSLPDAATIPSGDGPPVGTLGLIGGVGFATLAGAGYVRRRSEKLDTATA